MRTVNLLKKLMNIIYRLYMSVISSWVSGTWSLLGILGSRMLIMGTDSILTLLEDQVGPLEKKTNIM
jgi:hypothetical protein